MAYMRPYRKVYKKQISIGEQRLIEKGADVVIAEEG